MNESNKEWLQKYAGLLTEDRVTKKKVGHKDNEAESLRRELYKMEQYASDLKEMMVKLEGGDIPSWIQKKLVLASDYMSTVKHYLEYEIDKK